MDNEDRPDRRWWLEEYNDREHEVVVDLAKTISDADARRDQMRRWRNAYTMRGDGIQDELIPRRTRHNVIRRAIQTVFPRIAKARPRPWPVTRDGDWNLRQRAKAMSLLLDGEFERLGVYKLTARALKDSMIYGTGVLKPYVDSHSHRPVIDRVWPGDVLVDPREERLSSVRTYYQVHFMDREVAKQRWPEHDGAIADADLHIEDVTGTASIGDAVDLITVIEAWRLPTGGVPGRHCICVDKATLESSELECEDPPFVFIHWEEDPERFFGMGMVEMMFQGQQELNIISKNASDARRLMVPVVFIPQGSKIGRSELTNETMSAYTYSGQMPPTVQYPAGVAQDLVMQERDVKAQALEDVGVSQMAATSQKPAGLNSGKAINAFEDVESVGFFAQGKAYEDAHVDLAKALVRCFEEIAGSDLKESEKAHVLAGKDSLESVSYSDGKMGRDQYRLRIFPANSLSTTPSARLQDVQDMMSAGIITPEEGRELMEMPDLERFNSVKSAGRDLVNKLIEECLSKDTGPAPAPSGYMPLDYAIRWGNLRLALAERQGCPDPNLDRLRSFLALAMKLQQRAMQAAQPQQPAAPGSAMAPPAMPAAGGAPVAA